MKTAMRHHDTLMRMTNIQDTEGKCWGGCGAVVTLIRCWCECQKLQPLWKAAGQFQAVLSIHL